MVVKKKVKKEITKKKSILKKGENIKTVKKNTASKLAKKEIKKVLENTDAILNVDESIDLENSLEDFEIGSLEQLTNKGNKKEKKRRRN